MSSKKAIVIGAGIAGIASAIRLAVQGLDVTVFEKNGQPGGKLSRIEINGYAFDTGPSLFTQPQNIEELFALANEPMDAYFSYERLPVSCQYFYEDGTQLTAFADIEKFETELQQKHGEPAGALTGYLKQSADIYNNIGKVFLNYSLHKLKTLFKAPVAKALLRTKRKYLFGTMNAMHEKHFSNPKTVQLFNRYATYNGSSPYKAPGMLTLIPHVEHNEGVFYPKGGMHSITKALYELAIKKGVQFRFDTTVQRIIQHDNKVHGIVANNENIYADVVVSNMDVYFTYKHLLGNETKSKKLLKQERSSSALIFYWGIKQGFPQLGLHNILFSNQYKAEFDTLFTTRQPFNDPTVYINVTSKCEEGTHAPNGKENWFVMINVPANVGQNWTINNQQYRKAIIEKINRVLQTDIEPLIEAEEILDPVLIESNTSSYRGSLYGTASNTAGAAFLRHPNFTSQIKGLYFVGGSVHPGGGIPLCLQSAKIMASLVQHDFKKANKH